MEDVKKLKQDWSNAKVYGCGKSYHLSPKVYGCAKIDKKKKVK